MVRYLNTLTKKFLVTIGSIMSYNVSIIYRRHNMTAEVGDMAPDFTLKSHTGEDITLGE